MRAKLVAALALCGSLGAGTSWGQEPPPAQEGAAPPPTSEQPAPGGAPTPAAPPPIEEKAVAPPPPAKPEEAPTQERFKQALSPHGRWVPTPEYGEVWVPSGVAADWRPYSHGRWVYTRHGWTFVSYDPWGWAPFHYGRWAYRPPYGWSWIPGYEWAPAWVTWRYGGAHVAWAPLGPLGVGVSYYHTPSLWIGVRGPHFYRPLVRSYFIPTGRMGGVFRGTYFAGVPRGGRYFSPPVRYISRVVGRPIVRVSARRLAPRWAGRGYNPRVALRGAFRGGRVIARPGRGFARGRAFAAPRGRGLGARGPAFRGPRGSAFRGPRGPAFRGPGSSAFRGPRGPAFRGPGSSGSRPRGGGRGAVRGGKRR